MLQQRRRGLVLIHMGIARLLLAAWTSIGNGIVLQQPYLFFGSFNFPPDKLLSDPLQLVPASAANLFLLGQVQNNFLNRKSFRQFVHGALGLPGVGLHHRLLCRLRRFRVLDRLRLVEYAHLFAVRQNITALFAGLPEPRSLGIQQQFVRNCSIINRS